MKLLTCFLQLENGEINFEPLVGDIQGVQVSLMNDGCTVKLSHPSFNRRTVLAPMTRDLLDNEFPPSASASDEGVFVVCYHPVIVEDHISLQQQNFFSAQLIIIAE